MGKKSSKVNEMPESIESLAVELFKKIDGKQNGYIDREETMKYWNNQFAKLNTHELFMQVDENDDGSISLDEWLHFWEAVFNSGHSEEDIISELNNLLEGGVWVKFENVNRYGRKKSSIKNGKD